ncbi:MAG: peptide-methionine (S)-S-oxide reductase MsrA [Gammaproteobacteria bacterium]|nr:peptide-methionine (S)-S-oxide reductase MsrA [Gammaproteobacteria bacterium]
MHKLIILFILTVLASAIPGKVFSRDSSENKAESSFKTAVFAGGCFWCVESDFEKLEGVAKAVSGYTGGTAATATYKQVGHVESEHYEAVEVSYDPAIVSYAELVEYFWRQIDPTDPKGQFCDKGSSYRSALFYATDEEKAIIQNSLAALEEAKPFDGPIVTAVLPAKPFYIAEKYHQDYYKKNPFRYKYYRNGCRRDKRLAELWGQ